MNGSWPTYPPPWPGHSRFTINASYKQIGYIPLLQLQSDNKPKQIYFLLQ